MVNKVIHKYDILQLSQLRASSPCSEVFFSDHGVLKVKLQQLNGVFVYFIVEISTMSVKVREL